MFKSLSQHADFGLLIGRLGIGADKLSDLAHQAPDDSGLRLLEVRGGAAGRGAERGGNFDALVAVIVRLVAAPAHESWLTVAHRP